MDRDFRFAGPLVSFCIHGMVCMEKNARQLEYVRRETGKGGMGFVPPLDWNQVGDEDNYIAQQTSRIDGLHNQFMMMDGRLTEANNEASMGHDYMVGLHYSVVELGGFLRFLFGVEPNHLISMGIQERANLVACNTMGAGQYLNLVRQRAYVEAGETTDVQMTANQTAEEIA